MNDYFPKPVARLSPDSPDYDRLALIKPTGFREYDARWLYRQEINLKGVEALGLGLGTMIHRRAVAPQIVTGHDYRSYSEEIKIALTQGLIAAGCQVHDIGLALSPTAYFAQIELGVPGVAMVTASHNENGWTGVKMGLNPPLTFSPDDMTELKTLVLAADFETRTGGKLIQVPGMAARYIADLSNRNSLKNPLKVVVACGNGTAGAFAPKVLEAVGAEIVPLHCELDYTFPHYNPNPEDMKMLADISAKVLETGADIGLAFDGDGDRCGTVDNEGREIFADKVGVLLARDISAQHAAAHFIADVKSTGLFATDPVLRKNGATTEYWKTGHSYIKQRAFETHALAGFEKSGHYFFSPPLGRGYDDGLVSALAICDMLDRNPGKTMADLIRTLPKTWGSPTMSPHCPDEQKYDVVTRAVTHFTQAKAENKKIAGSNIRELITINGIRIVLDDGTWGLIRASSNKPELVIVVESPVSGKRMHDIFAVINDWLADQPEVGAFNQTI